MGRRDNFRSKRGEEERGAPERGRRRVAGGVRAGGAAMPCSAAALQRSPRHARSPAARAPARPHARPKTSLRPHALPQARSHLLGGARSGEESDGEAWPQKPRERRARKRAGVRGEGDTGPRRRENIWMAGVARRMREIARGTRRTRRERMEDNDKDSARVGAAWKEEERGRRAGCGDLEEGEGEGVTEGGRVG